MRANKKTESAIILIMSLLFGVMFWLVDGLFEYHFFHENLSFLLLEGPDSLWEALFSKIPPHSLFVRFSFIAASLMGGILTALFVYRKRKSDEALLESRREKTDLQSRFNRSRKMESMGILVGSVAHDLNNILSGVVNYPEMLLIDRTLNGGHRELVASTLESGQRAVAVVSDLLTIARGLTSPKPPLDLNSLVREFLSSPEFLELRKAHPHVSVETDLKDNPVRVNGSALHIRKALMNLVANAAEAVTAEGVIRIGAGRKTLAEPHSGYTEIPPGDYAVLTVSDTGGGISQEDLGQIFQPFYTRKMMGRSGTGLGLTVVWNTIQDHEGYIDVTNGPDGAVFQMYFETTQAPAERPGPAAARSLVEYKGAGEKILVIDDEPTQQDIARRILGILGYRAEAVGSGEEAVDYLKVHSADLLVLDMFMKDGMNGPETYEAILKINPRQKAIIASGYAEDRSVRRTQAAGAGAFLIKPYDMETIGRAIRKELKGA